MTFEPEDLLLHQKVMDAHGRRAAALLVMERSGGEARQLTNFELGVTEEPFVSLYRAGDTPAELVLYPGENHHFLGEGAPSTRVDACKRIAGWVSRHVQVRHPAGDLAVPSGATSRRQQKETT